jgi:predicted N-formylglutamate amidohydrolase
MFKPRPSAQTASAFDACLGFRREDALLVENEAGAAAAVVFDDDRRLSAPLLQHFRARADLVVGENVPYSPDDRVYHGLGRHAQPGGLPSVMIEIRNDLVATRQSQAQWSERLATAIARALPAALLSEPDQPAIPACQTDNSFHRGTT